MPKAMQPGKGAWPARRHRAANLRALRRSGTPRQWRRAGSGPRRQGTTRHPTPPLLAWIDCETTRGNRRRHRAPMGSTLKMLANPLLIFHASYKAIPMINRPIMLCVPPKKGTANDRMNARTRNRATASVTLTMPGLGAAAAMADGFSAGAFSADALLRDLAAVGSFSACRRQAIRGSLCTNPSTISGTYWALMPTDGPSRISRYSDRRADESFNPCAV